jgi:hypothetical protein
MAPLTELGKGEATFEVNGLQITVRTLTPEEEIATQRYARGALVEGDANDQINALDYLDKFRVACLGYSIIQIGETDFRNVTTIETGDKLASGVAVKIKKHEAIIQVMASWSRPMVVAVFQRFTSLMEKIEDGVEKSMKFDDDHLDAQIIRLEERLTELKASKVKRDAGKADLRSETLAIAANKSPTVKPEEAPKVEKPATWDTVDTTKTTSDPALSVAEPSDIPRKLETAEEAAPAATAVPERAPVAPVAVQPDPAQEAPREPRKPLFVGHPAPREAPEAPHDPLGDVASSLVDTSDPAVIEAENRRLAVERARRLGPAKPPHQSAREVAEALEKEEIRPAGTMGGVPVFQMPVQELNPETIKVPERPQAPAVRSSVNPRFRPAGK